MNLLLYMAPIAVVFLLPATLIMEENVVGITLALAREDPNIIWYLLFNSSLAYFVNLTNFLVTKHTSALTLQVFLVFLEKAFSKCHSNFVHKLLKLLYPVNAMSFSTYTVILDACTLSYLLYLNYTSSCLTTLIFFFLEKCICT